MGMILLILIGSAVGALLIVAASKPNVSRIQRSITITAAPNVIFSHVENLQKWREWSPWEALDPDMYRSYSGPDSGVGAVYEWRGSGKAGAGRMEITEVTANAKLILRLDFVKPFKSASTCEFIFQSQGGDTVVTWAMSGPQPFPVKVMGTIFNMDDLIGKDFEAGLKNLKTLAEGDSPPPALEEKAAS